MRCLNLSRLSLMALLAMAVVGGITLVSCSRAQADYLYENYTTSDTADAVRGNLWRAQTFMGESTHYVNIVRLPLYRVGSPGSIHVSIKELDVAGLPHGPILTWGNTDGNTLTTDTGGEWRNIQLFDQCHVHKGSHYAIVVSAISGDAGNYVGWKFDSSAGYAGGSGASSIDGGGNWYAAAWDYSFHLRYDGWPGLWPDTYCASGDNADAQVKANQWLAQSFILESNMSATQVQLMVYRHGLPGLVYVGIQPTTTGSLYPTGNNLAVGYLDGNSLDEAAGWCRVEMQAPVHLLAGVQYALVLFTITGDDDNHVCWRYSTAGAYSGGNYLYNNDAVNWHKQTGYDFIFGVFGVPTAFPAIFRQGGTWFIDYNRNGVFDPGTDPSFGPFGQQAGDGAVVTDVGSETSHSMAVFRSGTWFIDRNHNGRFNPGTDVQSGPFGQQAGDIPLSIRWNDGYYKLAIFRPGGSWYIDTNQDGIFEVGSDTCYLNSYGKSPGDLPVAIDWDGDGRQEMAIFRPSTGMWYIDMDHNGTFDPAIDTQLGPFGTTAGDIPVAIDWDGDGRQEACIFRTTGPNKGKWYIDSKRNGVFDSGTDVQLGPFGSTAGDQPLAIWWTQ